MTNKRRPWNALPRCGGTAIVAFAITLSSWSFAAPPDSKMPGVTTQFEGSFDKMEAVSLGGWAWDGSQPNTPIKVEIYDGSTLLATILSDGFRDDLKVAGKGDGRHAFNYALPQNLRDGRPHTISVRYAGTKSDLPGSPKTLTFPKS